jgi:kynurenine formamidase
VVDVVLRPTFEELRSREGYPPRSSWGLWGDDDQIGALNLITEREVRKAARLVERGAVFPLNWGLENPDPALFGRGPLAHHKRDDGFGMDDHFDNFFPHGSSHWDSLGHFSHPEHGYYGGRPPERLKGPEAENSAAEWARRGVAGRFVLADVERRRREEGRPIAQSTDEAVSIEEVALTLEAAGVQIEQGDILLVRMGWIAWYEALGEADRAALAEEEWGFAAPGLAAGEETLEWLWDSGVAAVATDVPAVEAFPFDPRGESLHANLLALLGINLGEMFALDDLAADCGADDRYVGLLTSAPMNFTGATGSPANALALK